MRVIVPDYYMDFRCKAAACRHNCCREGWEIGIDDAHAHIYKAIASNPENRCSKELTAGVFLPSVKERRKGQRPHILLSENGSCPFLSDDGLCDLMKNYGEDILCQICADHPRFRNFYADHIETGIGMCCEEAVHLVLHSEYPVSYRDYRTGECLLPEHRKGGRTERYLTGKPKKLDILSAAEYLLSLDALEPGWAAMLKALNGRRKIKTPGYPDTDVWKKIEEYFLYRHLLKDGAAFTSFLLELIRGLYECADVLPDMEPEDRLSEILRIFSSETEYSEEATEAIKKILQN